MPRRWRRHQSGRGTQDSPSLPLSEAGTRCRHGRGPAHCQQLKEPRGTQHFLLGKVWKCRNPSRSCLPRHGRGSVGREHRGDWCPLGLINGG